MIKRMILTYYYVFLQAHTRSKYGKDFTNSWVKPYLQLAMTQSFILFHAFFLIDMLFDLKITKSLGRYGLVAIFFIIPSLILDHLLFNIYKADKDNDEPIKFGITITKRNKIISWLVYVLVPLLLINTMYWVSKFL